MRNISSSSAYAQHQFTVNNGRCLLQVQAPNECAFARTLKEDIMIVDLKGKWQFCDTISGEMLCGNVPSSNISDLLNLGLIPNPFEKTYENEVSEICNKDWLYKRTFFVENELLNCDKVFLFCAQLDTICDVNLNGQFVARSINCHLPLRIDVKAFLHLGENEISIKFYSPVNYVTDKYNECPTPPNPNGRNGVAHIRKPQCHFGWDWGPVLPVSGISGDIYLEGIIGAEIRDLTVKQRHNADGCVKLTLNAEVQFFSDASAEVEFVVNYPDGRVVTILESSAIKREIAETVFYTAETAILNAELWWTKELSNKDIQPLYEVKAVLKKSGTEVSQKSKKIGLRMLTLDRAADCHGENFCFVLNGKKIFCKGANYIPPDSLITRVNDSDYRELIDAAVFSNINMLRIWGGGYYAPDALLDECDKRGIFIWQDFAYACQAYPHFDDEFRNLTISEARSQIRRMRSHPSLALWCGNNEIEQMSALWFYASKYLSWTKKYFHEILPAVIKEEDDRPYIPSSPVGVSYKKGVFADNVGDTHLWAVWHGLQPLSYYSSRYTRFCSEFGFESLPSLKTLHYFADEKDFDLNSEVFLAHQKCNSGNMKMQYYALERFHLPSRFSDYIYLSQYCQSECVREATEHWRRNKGRCNGSLYWQLNDCWPVCSWSSMDYFKRYKMLQYTARRFFAPVAVSINRTKDAFEVYTLNDTFESFECETNFKVCNYSGKVLFEENCISKSKAEASELQIKVTTKKIKYAVKCEDCYAVATLIKNDTEISRSVLLLKKEKHSNLPVPKISKEISFSNGLLTIVLSSNVFAHTVWLNSDFSDEHFSDNCFDILPKEQVTVTLPCQTPPENLDCAVDVFNAADLTRTHGALYELWFKLKVILRPMNFANILVYKFGAKNLGKKTLTKLQKKESK